MNFIFLCKFYVINIEEEKGNTRSSKNPYDLQADGLSRTENQYKYLKFSQLTTKHVKALDDDQILQHLFFPIEICVKKYVCIY